MVAVLLKEHPLSSTIVTLYVPAVNPVTCICCGLLGMLSDQVNVNGGVPDEMKVVIEPLLPVPQEVE